MAGRQPLVLVTGGAGFIGSALTRKLLDAGASVHNLDFIPNRFQHDNLTHFTGSFLDHGLLREAMAGADLVYHLAATGFAAESNKNPARDAQENVVGTAQLLAQAAASGVGRFVYCSSGGTVYGPTDLPLIPETAPTNPIAAYGVSKLACEKYVRLYDGASAAAIGATAPGQRGMSTVTLRVANPYGPGQNIGKAQGALTTFCVKAVNGETITIWGDGEVTRDFIHVEDVAEALLVAGRASEVSGTEINIGSGVGASLNEILAEIARHLPEPPRVDYLPARSFDVPRNVLDTARAREMLGWTPRVSLAEGVESLLRSLREGARR